jgi:hypothetical protein
MKLWAYLAIVGLLAMILISMNLNWAAFDKSDGLSRQLCLLLAFLTHIPAAMTVAAQRRSMGEFAGGFGPFPEIAVVGMLLTVWLIIGLTIDGVMLGAIVGFVICAMLAICYLSVRLSNVISKRTISMTSHVPCFVANEYLGHETRSIYILRVLSAATSLSVMGYLLATNEVLVTGVLVSIAIACGALTIVASTWMLQEDVISQVKKQLPNFVAASHLQRPADVLLYYSNLANAKHSAPMALTERFANEDLKFSLITREGKARSVLQNTQAKNVWLAPDIGSLDAFAQPQFRAVFYVNDGVKNGHFIRFGQYVHILVATGNLAKVEVPSRNLAMYDAIVAPCAKQAALWRENADASVAKLVVTIGAESEIASLYKSKKGYLSDPLTLALHVDAAAVENDQRFEYFQTLLPALITAVEQTDGIKLNLWFPKRPLEAAQGRLRVLHAAAQREIKNLQAAAAELPKGVMENPQPPNTKIKLGDAAAAANSSSIVLATAASELSILRQISKPVIWAGVGDTPKGIRGLDLKAEMLRETLFAVGLDTDWSVSSINDHPQARGDFANFGDLVDHLVAEKDQRRAGE